MSSTIAPIHRVLALPGSLRRASYNRLLLDAAAAHAPRSMRIEVYEALREVPLFDEDLEATDPDGPEGVRRLRDAIAAADGLLIATPEYNQSLPGVLKNAIDWLSRDTPRQASPLNGKPVAIVGVTAGRWGTRYAQAALRHTLTATGAVVMPSPMLFVNDAASRLDAERRSYDAGTMESMQRLLEAFDDWIGWRRRD